MTTRTTPKRPAGAVVLGGLAVLALAGCTFGPASVDKSEVEKQTSAKLAEQVGRAPEDVSCPEDLPAKVGASITCVLTDGGQSYDTTVTVTSVEGSDVKFDIKVADSPS